MFSTITVMGIIRDSNFFRDFNKKKIPTVYPVLKVFLKKQYRERSSSRDFLLFPYAFWFSYYCTNLLTYNDDEKLLG